MLHAAKYPTRPILGLLLANAAHTDSSKQKEKDAVYVNDVVPLFHTHPLTPMIEIALNQVETMMQTHHPTAVMAGVYVAGERHESLLSSSASSSSSSSSTASTTALPSYAHVAAKISERMRANSSTNGKTQAGGRLAILDNVRLGHIGAAHSESTHSALESYELRSGKWHASGSIRVSSSASASSDIDDATQDLDECVQRLKQLLAEEAQRRWNDFDDHLDDATADWTNRQVDEKMLPTQGLSSTTS